MTMAAMARTANILSQSTRRLDGGPQTLKEKARHTAQEFESVFMKQMLERMFEGVKTDGPFGGGHSEEVYRSMLVDEYARDITRAGGIGLTEQVMAEIIALQEAQQ